MYFPPCYRKNLTSPRTASFRARFARLNVSGAALVAFVCMLACLCLAACSKSAAQYIQKGNQLFDGGKYADAILNYRNAIKKAPDSGEAYYRLGLSAMRQGQAGEAYQAFNHAVTLSPTNIPAKVELGELSLAVYARDPRHPAALYNQAQSMAQQLLAPGGDRVAGLRMKAALALIDNHPENAVEAMQQAVQLAPGNPETGGGLAESLLRDNRPDEAEKVARQTLDEHPTYNPSYEVLYSIYASKQNWDKAEGLLKQW